MKDNLFGWKIENSYVELPEKFYKSGSKNNFPNVELVIYNKKLAKELGLKENLEKSDLLYFSGDELPENSKPIHQAYAGHQFGYFTMLGDGRAMLIGEQFNNDGERFDIQLKGSGKSYFSRGGDGKATLKAMLREYLMSEAMFYLNIPTTRSLAVVKTGEDVFRETLNDGAVLTRVAKSHIRVGTFQYSALGTNEDIFALSDYTIKRHFPEIKDDKDKYVKFLEKVIDRQAKLISKWQLVGFIHGVMNTDNISISGETIDYGPCAFMDRYNPKTAFSSIDRNGRYRYENQPAMGQWGLSRFAESIMPTLNKDENIAFNIATELMQDFKIKLKTYWIYGMEEKLGIIGAENSTDIISKLFELMEEYRTDYTNTFVRLTLELMGKSGEYLDGTSFLFKSREFEIWRENWKSSIIDIEDSIEIMKKSNPYIIPRNYNVEYALQEISSGNMEFFNEFLNALQNPFEYDESLNKFQNTPKMENYKTYCGT